MSSARRSSCYEARATPSAKRDRLLHWRLEGLLIIAVQYDPALYPLAAERLAAVRRAEAEGARVTSGVLLAACASEEARAGTSMVDAIDYAERALANGALEPVDEVFRMHALFTLTLAGKAEDAARAYAAAIAETRLRGNLYNLSVLHLFSGLLRTQRGELLAAEEDIEWSNNPAVDHSPLHAAYHRGFLADVLIERGELDAARDLLDRPLADFEEGHRIYLEYARGRLRLEAGQPEQALADFTRVGKIAEPLGIQNPAWVPWRSQAAIAMRRLGRTNEARELARQELELSRLWGAPRTIGISLRALGLVEGGEARASAASRGGRSACRLAGAARACPCSDRPGRGAAPRQTTAARLGRCCGKGSSSRIAAERRRWSNSRTRSSRRRELIARTIVLSGLESLTASERRVAQMAAEDLSNKEIAQALFVTVKTVEQHLGRVYRKLDISSRRQLGAALGGPAEAPTPA